MNPIKNVAYVLVIAVLLVGCDDFGNLNVDSNNPSEVRTDLLLANAQTGMGDVVGAATPAIWVQFITETQYDDVPRYSPTEANFNSWYYDELQDLQTIIDLNTDEETKNDVLAGGSNANQIAAARILKVYFFQMITDRWGDVPYSEALQGRENLSPAYDDQEDIYADLVVELQEAVDQMDSGAGVSGDILFEGDMGQWALFANSLRARVALRMADSAPDLAETHFTDAVEDGLITESVMYPYLADADNENPWYTRFRTRTDYAISDVIGDYMLNLDDNRILVYANPAPAVDNNNGVVEFSEIVPMDYDEPSPGDVTNSSISFPGSAIGAGGEGIQDAPLPIITVAELEFAQAEAVERGWITGGVAADHYNNGIEASWAQWGVLAANTANFEAYLASPEVAYSSAEWEEKIGTQKWAALYPNGYEAYAEWRRIGYPELEPHDRALTESGEIPLRFTYPATEAEINAENYEAAVSSQGPDTPDTRVWWDVD